MQNNNRAWNLLLARMENIDKKVDCILSKVNGFTGESARQDEKMKAHDAALKWLFGIMSGVVVALVIAWLRVTVK